MTDGQSLSFTIPHFTGMSDDEVAAHPLARVRDGRWSPLTKMLLEEFETEKLDLNEAWAETWQLWECPCCRRPKYDIARLSADGVLLCRIDLHHDHLADHAKALFREIMTEPLPDEVAGMRMRARAVAHSLIPRFTATLICADCNQADANMKAVLGDQVPSYFSFSPVEIAGFIEPAPNKPHAINEAAGQEIWDRVRQSFDDRVAFTRSLVERVAAGCLDIEVGPHPYGYQRSEESMLYDLAHRAAGVRSNLGRMSVDLLARSRSTDGNRSNTGRRSRRRVQTPTAADFEAVSARNAQSRPWTSAGDDWRCTVCERSKFEIVRKSNRGAWAGAINHLCMFVEETDPENQVRRAQEHSGPIMLRSHHHYSLCQDCRHIVGEASKAVPGTDEHCFRPEDLRTLIGEPTPHRLPDVDTASIRDAVWANGDWIAATRDYWAHRSEATDIYSSVHIQMKRGLAAREAKRLVFDQQLARRKITDPGYARMTWLLREGARLCREDRLASNAIKAQLAAGSADER